MQIDKVYIDISHNIVMTVLFYAINMTSLNFLLGAWGKGAGASAPTAAAMRWTDKQNSTTTALHCTTSQDKH